ncbi:universal stress protein YxiE-like [Symsagittifera roscoffensis]|uniref:universal stress protein YxiE-like n=1 Tax=Symsagittifera roscoffensis TaxID=84072 RepID=UPI00307BE32E
MAGTSGSGSISGSISGVKRKIVVCIDGSDCSVNALEWYLNNLRKPDDTVVLLQVTSRGVGGMSLPVDAPVDVPQNSFDNIVTSQSGNDDVYITELKESYSGILLDYECDPSTCQFVSLNDNSPGSAICKFAKQNGVHHIVIGTRGLGKIKRKFLGSVSDHVIHNSNSSVSIVPNNNPTPT